MIAKLKRREFITLIGGAADVIVARYAPPAVASVFMRCSQLSRTVHECLLCDHHHIRRPGAAATLPPSYPYMEAIRGSAGQ